MKKKQTKEKPNPNYWKACTGCPDGHSSFWRTIATSPEWQAWYKEQQKRFHKLSEGKNVKEIYDINESQECGWLGKEHWASFVKFIKSGKI